MGKPTVTASEFVLAYLKRGGDLGAVASDLGVRKASVYQRVSKMRKAGIKLPVQRKGKGYNISELNKLIKEFKRNA